MTSAGRNVISLDDLSAADLRSIIARGAEIAQSRQRQFDTLNGTVVGIYFRKTSTRTRTAFSSGALRLGARIISYGPDDWQTNTGESYEDTGRILSGMLDVLVARTAGDPAEMRALGAHRQMPVVNAMSDEEHPTQALTDLTTMLCRFGCLEGRRVLYIGEGNNTAAALALSLSRFEGTELHLRTPPGYGISESVRARALLHAEQNSAIVTEHHDMDDLPTDVDVIYTTRWQTTGTTKADPDWRETFRPFHVGTRLWQHSPKALFMHDLPAHRGDEVSADVLDGSASIAFEQATNKMHSAMAVLEWCRQ
ncbi:ornithine carbamoyltransferase [Streptomyces sp. NPDC002742]|uniref:ornithine carbamoyltransferase n=1 Tax=Streptomyces sp. NPDC002742 TaxID=3364663 RepID=UPI003696470C